MKRDDDDGGDGRMHRGDRSRGHDITHDQGESHRPPAVPGKSTLTERLPFAAPEAAARNAVRAAVGGSQRIATWIPQLMTALASASYGESGRLSFEIRSALRRARMGLTDLERQAPEEAAAIADLVASARAQLLATEREAAMLLRAAPVLEDPAAGSADAEAAWTEARTRANSGSLDASSTAENADAPAWQQDADAIAGALGLADVSVHSDDTARSLTDAKDARGVALGDAIYMHPNRVRPGTPEGREVLAHELVHLAQARLPREAGDGRAAAEREAARLAPTVARGGSARPGHFIDLSRAAADRDAQQEIAAAAAEPTLPAGVDYQVVEGSDAVLANRVWLTGSAHGRQMLSGRMAVLLGALRTAGRLSWADKADLDALAKLPAKISVENTTKVVRIDLAASAYHAVGLPPGATSIVSANGDGLEITTRLPGFAADARGARTLDTDAKQELIAAIEAAVGIAVNAEGNERFLAMELTPVFRHGTVWIRLTGEDCRALFDAEQWEAHRARNRKTDAPSVAARGGAEVTSSSELRPDEREWFDRWCAAHLSKGPSTAPTVTMYQLARRIDAAGPARDAILARLGGVLGPDKPIDAAALELALHEGQVDAARITAGLDPLASGNRDAAPLYQVPLPARIVPHATEILDGDSVALELAVDWPAEHLSLLDQLARQRTNPFRVEVDWVIARLDGSDRVVAHTKGATEALTRSQRFKLQAGETRGTWTIQAFLRSTYFYPAAVATQIEVVTEAARLAELRTDAMGDLGGDALTQAAHDFDIGVVDDSVSPDRDDHGVRLAGELPPGYVAPTDAQRAENRARERETQTQLLAYLEKNAPEATAAIDAVKRSLARMDVVEKTLASDVTGGWRSFQVRGTYFSRDADVPSGPLDLYGTVEYQTHVELNPTEQREQTPPKVVSGVAVRLRDLSRRFENAAPIYTGFAPTFEAAFEAAFVDLCKAYPDGKVSVLAEELSPDGSGRTGKTVGFELGTSSRLERVKEAVWDPTVNLIVNAAAIALMAFAPFTTPIAFALLAANNTLRTVDELRTHAERGLLTDHKIKMSMASIAFDILPFAKYAKVVRSNDWVRYAIEGADHGGQVALMTHEVRDVAIQLQEQDVMALAEMYRDLTELERTSHPNDPRVKQRRDEIEERAREVGKRGYDAFAQVAGTRGLFMIASHQFQKLSASAAGALGVGQGKPAEVDVDAVSDRTATAEAATASATSKGSAIDADSQTPISYTASAESPRVAVRAEGALSEKRIRTVIVSEVALIAPKGAKVVNQSTLELHANGARTRVTVTIASLPDVPATFQRAADGSYRVTVSDSLPDHEVTRVLAHEMTRVQRDFEAHVGVRAGADAPEPEVAARAAELRAMLAEVDRHGARGGEAAGSTRAADVDTLLDAMGIDSSAEGRARASALAFDPPLQRRVMLHLDGYQARPALDRASNLDAFAGQRQARLDHLEHHVTGVHASDMVEVEDLALGAQLRLEEGHRIFDGSSKAKPERGTSDDKALKAHRAAMVATLNDPSLSPADRRGRLLAQIAALESDATMSPDLKATIDVTAMRRAVEAYDTTGQDQGTLVLDVSAGTVARPGDNDATPTTVRELMRKIDHANEAARANGIGVEYVLIIHRPTKDASGRELAHIEVIARRCPQSRLGAAEPAKVPGNQGTGDIIVDVGVGRGGFAVEGAERRPGDLVVQTEYIGAAEVGQISRTAPGITDPGPVASAGGVVVFTDFLARADIFHGSSAEAGSAGIRQVFINNVSAHFKTKTEYLALARQLAENVSDGGTVEIQWTQSPEAPGGKVGSRGHIDGETLVELLRGVGRRFTVDEDQRPIGSDFTIDAATVSTPDPDKVGSYVPPVPERRVVITFHGAPLERDRSNQ